MTGDRARLTPVDVAWVGVAVFMFGTLVVPIYGLYNENVGALGTGDAALLRAIIPATLIAVAVVIMATSAAGQ
jgi:hypothetical protein